MEFAGRSDKGWREWTVAFQNHERASREVGDWSSFSYWTWANNRRSTDRTNRVRRTNSGLQSEITHKRPPQHYTSRVCSDVHSWRFSSRSSSPTTTMGLIYFLLSKGFSAYTLRKKGLLIAVGIPDGSNSPSTTTELSCLVLSKGFLSYTLLKHYAIEDSGSQKVGSITETAQELVTSRHGWDPEAGSVIYPRSSRRLFPRARSCSPASEPAVISVNPV